MRNLLTAVFAILTIGMFSCQKEVKDIFAPSGSGNGTRLIKAVDKSGTDSTVTIYGYNAAGKITSADFSGIDSGQAFDLSIRYVRNSSNIIQQQIVKSSDFSSLGIDSLVTYVRYDQGTNRYINAVSSFILFGLPLADSIVFQYDGSGRLVTEIDYTDVGFGYDPVTKKDYIYAGNNLATEKVYQYDFSSSTYSLEDSYTYEYDTKVNPLQFATDAPVLNLFPFYSANNVLKTTYVSSDPAYNFVMTEAYTYNSSNRPVTDISTTGSDVTTTTYYYH
jgi:hypothetical protein